MIRIAELNAEGYHLTEQVTYTKGSALAMRFPKNTFDMVFSNSSMHEWEDPVRVFGEIQRVLRNGGTVIILGLKRDLEPYIYLQMYESWRPETI